MKTSVVLEKSTLLLHYKRRDIQQAIIEQAEGKEIAVKFGDKGFGKRPDTLQYTNDIMELVKQGVTSFHVSEELWDNPLMLSPTLKRQELDELRKGWDLILDIDCEFLEYSAIAADLLIKALKHSGISSITCKFSGNHGFHIAVPFEAFPKKVNGIPVNTLFPEAPRKIAGYLQQKIKKYLSQEILRVDDINTIIKRSGKAFNDVVKDGEFDPFSILDVDTILISSRHLYRMLYSFNEKSGLISVPIDPEKAKEFKKSMAEPKNVKVKHPFLTREGVKPEEAKQLFLQAYDFSMKRERELEDIRENMAPKADYEDIKEAIPEEFFPPCIKNGFKGLEDGKKRFMFVAVNFLSSAGWGYDQIENRLHEWNKMNTEPLRENYIVGHIRYHKQQKKKVLPPNCNNSMYFSKGIGMCQPDNLCAKIKNPLNYSKRKTYYINQEQDNVFAKEQKNKEKDTSKPSKITNAKTIPLAVKKDTPERVKKLVVVDENDTFIREEEKMKCHEGDGILHRAFSAFIFNEKGKLLIQKRSKEKLLWPMHWSNSCCSHPAKDESYEEAAHRRVKEELGINCNFKLLFNFQYQAKYKDLGSENELCSVLIGRCDNDIEINADPEEVKECKFVTILSLKKDIKASPDKYTPWFKLELERVLKTLEE